MKRYLTVLILSSVFSGLQAQSISNLQVIDNGTPVISASASPTTRGTDEDIVHIVQQGENLYRITKSYGYKIQEIKDYNSITSDELYIGQKIRIPATATAKGVKRSGDPTTNTASNDTREVAPSIAETNSVPTKITPKNVVTPKNTSSPVTTTYVEKWTFHTVMPGDDLSSIADTYELSVDKLKGFNDNLEAEQLNVGDKLKVKKEFVPISTSVDITKELPSSETRNLEPASEPIFTVETPTPAVKTKATARLSDPVQRGKDTREEAPAVETPVTETPKNEVIVEPATVMGTTEESGTYIIVKDEKITDKYYAYHKTLAKGSVVKLQIPNNAGYIEVKILGKLRADRQEILGLSPDCARIIGGIKNAPNVKINY